MFSLLLANLSRNWVRFSLRTLKIHVRVRDVQQISELSPSTFFFFFFLFYKYSSL